MAKRTDVYMKSLKKVTNEQLSNKAKRAQGDGECTKRKMTKEERIKYGLE